MNIVNLNAISNEQKTDKSGRHISNGYGMSNYKERLTKVLITQGLNNEGIEDIIEFTESLIEELNARGLEIEFPQSGDIKTKANKKREKQINDFLNFWRSDKKLSGVGLFIDNNKPIKFNDPFIVNFINEVFDSYKEQKKDFEPIDRRAIRELVEESFYSNQIVILSLLIRFRLTKQGLNPSLRQVNITTYKVFEILGALPEKDEDNSNPFIYGHIKSFFSQPIKLPMNFHSRRLAMISGKAFSTLTHDEIREIKG